MSNTNLEMELIGALIGLAKTTYSSERNEETDRIIIQGLMAISSDIPNEGTKKQQPDFQDIITQIHEMKYTLSPGCLTCASPCGNTSDFDMKELMKESEQMRSLKFQLLEKLIQLALKHGAPKVNDPNDEKEFFYRGLANISYDLIEEEIQPLLTEVAAMI